MIEIKKQVHRKMIRIRSTFSVFLRLYVTKTYLFVPSVESNTFSICFTKNVLFVIKGMYVFLKRNPEFYLI